jgi:hypothetical protein
VVDEDPVPDLGAGMDLDAVRKRPMCEVNRASQRRL